jgi:DNA-binding IclR family transcriptional regulator
MRGEANNTAAKTIDLVLCLSQGPKPLNVISKETGIPKPSCHRLLAQLAMVEVVFQTDDQQYSLGVGALRLGLALINDQVWQMAFDARVELIELSSLTKETVALHVRLGRNRVCIAEVQSPLELRYTAGRGEAIALHMGSAGQILMAHLDSTLQEQYLSTTPLTALTSKTVTDPVQFRRLLGQVRERGWAESYGERISGATGISVPIFDASGVLVMALSVIGPSPRLPEERRGELVSQLQDVASRLSGTDLIKV